MEEEVSIPMTESEARKWLAEDSYPRKHGLEPDDAAYSIAQTIIVSSFVQQQENIIDLLSNVTAWTSIINELNKIVNNNTLIVILGTRGKRYEFYPKEYLSEQMTVINNAMKKYLSTNPFPGKYSFEDFKKKYTELLQGLVTAKSSSRPQRRTSNIHTLDDLKIIDKNVQLSAKELRDQQDALHKQQDQFKSQYANLNQKTQDINTRMDQFNQLFSGFKKDVGDAASWQKKYNEEHAKYGDEHIRSTKLSSENEALNAKLKSAQESIEQLQKDNEMLRNLMDQRKEELNTKMNEMSELQNAFNERKKEYEARINGQLPIDRQREQQLLQEKDAINARAEQLKYEIGQKTQEVLRLEADLKYEQQQLKTAQQQAEFERIRAERAEKRNESTMSSYLNAREELGRLTGQIAGDRQQMAMYKDQVGDLRAKTDAQYQKMMEMDEETTAYKVRTGIAETREEMTREQYNELKEKTQRAEEEMNRMRDYILHLERNNARLIGKTEQLQYQLQEGINAYGRLQLDYKTAVEDKDKAVSENIELRRQGNELVSNVHMLTYNAYTNGQVTEAFTNRDLKEQIRITQREREDYKEKTEKLESKLERKKDKEQKKKKKKERIKVQVEQNEKEKEQLSKELSQLRIEYAVQKKENEHYKEKIEELEKHGALVPINQVIPSSAQEQDLASTVHLRNFIHEALKYTVGENSIDLSKIYYGKLEMYSSEDEMKEKYKGMVGSDSGKAYAQFNSDKSKYDAAFLGIDRWFGDTKSVIWVRVDQYINWDTKNKRKLALQMEKLSYWNGIIESTKVPLLKDTEDLK